MILISIAGQGCFAQGRDSTLFFRGSWSVTHNGFSFIPSFSLGKPAAIMDVAVGNKRLSFEPQFRFALEGKPWSFIFIYRYKLINRSRFQLMLGGHLPSIAFNTQPDSSNGVVRDVMVSRRFLAGELAPTYWLSKNTSIGLYFLRGHGFDSGSIRDSHFLGLRSNFNYIKLTKRIFARFAPQFYYLKTDDTDGIYVTYSLIMAMKDFPLSISNIVNRAIQSDIPAKDFDWNVSLIYSFEKNYVRQ